MKQQRSNRTPLLDAIVSTVESRLRGLQRELESAAGGRFAKDILLTRFGPLEDQLGKDLTQCLDSELERNGKGQNEVSMELAVFIGRVAASLSTAPPFVEDKLGSGKSIKGVNMWCASLLFLKLGQNSKLASIESTRAHYLYGNRVSCLSFPIL